MGGPASTLLLLRLTLPSDDHTGANIGGGALWLLAVAVLGLGLVLGPAAAVARLLGRRSATPAAPGRRRGVFAAHETS